VDFLKKIKIKKYFKIEKKTYKMTQSQLTIS